MIKTFCSLSLSGKISLVFIILITLIAIFAPLIAPYLPDKNSGSPFMSPGNGHWLGTDELGYDILSQIFYGARVSLLVGFGTALLSSLLGAILGILSAYTGGWIDKIIMRIIDVIIILPHLPVMIVLAAFFGPGIINIIFVLTVFSWVIPARIIRAQVLKLKEMKYIKAAETYGAGTYYLTKKHFLPEVFPLIAVNIIRLSGRAIIAEAGLSFLGLGDPASRSWGLIIHHALNFEGIYFTPYWKWWLIYPVLFLCLLIVSLAFISRELENKYL